MKGWILRNRRDLIWLLIAEDGLFEYLFLVEAENYALHTILEAGAGDAEMAYFGGVGHVGASAEALVIVSNMNYADSFGSIGGEATHVEAILNLILGNVFFSDWHILCYDSVDVLFKGFYFFIGQGLGKVVIELRFLSFDMAAKSSAAAVSACHLSIEQMFGSMHRRKFLLIMLIQFWLFH